MYWNPCLLRWKGSGLIWWTLTLDVLKLGIPVIALTALSGWTLTLDVLKLSPRSGVAVTPKRWTLTLDVLKCGSRVMYTTHSPDEH